MFEFSDYIIEYTEVFRKAVDLMTAIYTGVPNDEDRYIILESIAGNCLHDVPDDLLDDFFANYKRLREDVKETCGEVWMNENE